MTVRLGFGIEAVWGGQMFGFFRSVKLYMQAGALCRDVFGFDLVALNKLSSDKIHNLLQTTGTKDHWTAEEGAVMVLCMQMILEIDLIPHIDFHEPNLRKNIKHGIIIDGWAAQGRVRPEIYAAFGDALDAVQLALEARGDQGTMRG